MAGITPPRGDSVYKINSWLGVRESPDGDTELKPGEAAEMRNFKITRDGNLQIRPGTKTLFSFSSPIRGMWRGPLAGGEITVCAAAGKLWALDTENALKTEIGSLNDGETFFFGFGNRLYMLDGADYKVWSGTGALESVSGYRPVVSVSVPPSGGGETFEQVNRLTGARRCRFSPDGASTLFRLPESGIESVDYVKITATGETVSPSAYTADLAVGTVTFLTAPVTGVNTYEIGWTHPSCLRQSVTAMRFAEIFNGTTDNRVFLYGDGTNNAIYSGLDENGLPTVDYFPELNTLDVGSANTPITSLIRHYSRLIAFKTDSAYTIRYGAITLEDGSTTAAFYTTPVNRIIGSAAPGQARLVLNSPYSLHGGGIYRWKNGSSYSSNLTVDERQAESISENVYSTLASFNMAQTRAFDDNYRREYYAVCGSVAVIHGYEAGAWYIYTDFPVTHMVFSAGETLCGTSDGKVKLLSRDLSSDDGRPIDAYWRSGSITFDRMWQRKYSPGLFVAMKPEGGGSVTVTVKTDRKSDNTRLRVSYSLATFRRLSFNAMSFSTNYQPRIRRLKIKAKKFACYQLIFQSCSAAATATLLSADVKVRYIGDVKS